MNRQIIDLSQNELLNYIVDNFKEDALLEISYNRVFIPGKILYIDKENGRISLNDCETVSRRISELLDEKDPIKDPYYLEVSSPGLDRPLKKEKDFIRYAGYDVEIKLYKPLNGTKQLEGELVGLTEDKKIKVIIDDNEVEFDKKDVAVIKLAIKF